jgi:hypothetical protein
MRPSESLGETLAARFLLPTFRLVVSTRLADTNGLQAFYYGVRSSTTSYLASATPLPSSSSRTVNSEQLALSTEVCQWDQRVVASTGITGELSRSLSALQRLQATVQLA